MYMKKKKKKKNYGDKNNDMNLRKNISLYLKTYGQKLSNK